MRGLNARALLANANVYGTYFPDKAESLAGEAMYLASLDGYADFTAGEKLPPVLFADTPLLLARWQDGFLEAAELQHAYSERLDDLITRGETEAGKGCGQSDVLWESRTQAAYREILAKAPAGQRESTLQALLARGFDPDFEEYQPRDNECSLTGVDTHCCPCGRHE